MPPRPWSSVVTTLFALLRHEPVLFTLGPSEHNAAPPAARGAQPRSGSKKSGRWVSPTEALLVDRGLAGVEELMPVLLALRLPAVRLRSPLYQRLVDERAAQACCVWLC